MGSDTIVLVQHGKAVQSHAQAKLVQEDVYLLLCQRYIELNPVRAAMVEDPEHYRWSSYLANVVGQSDALITPHPLYTAMATDDAGRRENYRALFRSQIDSTAIADIRLAVSQSQPLGNARFMDTIEKMTGQRREAKPRGRPKVQRPGGVNSYSEPGPFISFIWRRRSNVCAFVPAQSPN